MAILACAASGVGYGDHGGGWGLDVSEPTDERNPCAATGNRPSQKTWPLRGSLDKQLDGGAIYYATKRHFCWEYVILTLKWSG